MRTFEQYKKETKFVAYKKVNKFMYKILINDHGKIKKDMVVGDIVQFLTDAIKNNYGIIEVK